jgi:DNA repair protein RadC
MRIADLPPRERPREKAKEKGLNALSNAELLALILGEGVKGLSALDLAGKLLARFRSLTAIGEAEATALSEIEGVGEVKALLLKGVFEAATRIAQEEIYSDPVSPPEVYAHHRLAFAHKTTESLLVMLYDRKGVLRQEKTLYEGSEKKLEASDRGILAEALAAKATGFLIVHNHPSGVPLPSPGELTLTGRLKEKASSLGLIFLDHLIVAGDHYYSFKENGMI